MAKTTTFLTGSGALLTAVIGTTAWLMFRRPKTAKAASKPSGSTPQLPLPTKPLPPSPFVEGSHCTVLADEATTERWLREVVAPLVLPRIEAFAIPHHEHEVARRVVAEIVDDAFEQAVPECIQIETVASRQIWKWLWCDVTAQLVLRGKLDEELDDVLARCLDPSFHPMAPDTAPPEHPLPPFPMPQPLEPPVEPMDGSPAGAPPNLWSVTTRKELSEIGLMRMVEGTAAGAPIKGPSAHMVLLVYNPAWPELEHARADMMRLAGEHPQLSFVEASFVDTQRHFGKPKDLDEIIWVLAAAGPDGRVFPDPFVRDDPRDGPPTAELWAKMVAHASGFVGTPAVRKIVRPRRFGDLVRAMAARRRPPMAATSKSPPKARRGRPVRGRRSKPG